jgi:hypothetical protein
MAGGIVVKANRDVWLLFDTKADWTGFLVRANQNTLNAFDLDGEWIGYLSETLPRPITILL